MDAEEMNRQLLALASRVSALETELDQLRRISAGGPPATFAQQAPRSPESPPESSLESRIGSQLFNRVGIVAVLIAAAWFLKLAIDRGYLGPTARVLVGVAAGIGLIAGSEKFRAKGYAAFSYSLKAVGGGVLFLSIWAAYALFNIVGLAAAAVAMILVTAGMGALAWVQDSELLLAYALVGGFLSPLLLSNGHNHEASLFGYLLVMDMAALVLVVRKAWPRLALGLLLGTGLYAVGWYQRWYSPDQFTETLLFAAGTFLLFTAVPYLLKSAGIWLPLVTAASGFVAVVLLFHGDARAWVELLLAVFFFALAWVPDSDPALAAVQGVMSNGFLLAGVCFAIHQYWLGATDAAFSTQISYSAWFMLLGAALLGLGFGRGRAALRWQGLVLLSVAAAKVFLVDMSRLDQGYRVLSFLGLGLLLLAISFVYQRDLLGLRQPETAPRQQQPALPKQEH
jgi:uncharacterized membrane protein